MDEALENSRNTDVDELGFLLFPQLFAIIEHLNQI